MPVPAWLLKKMPDYAAFAETEKILAGVSTVCVKAACPNMLECFSRKQATFLILGDRCTRNCAFCHIRQALPLPPDDREPERVAEAAARLRLAHVVVTSVTRDDLPDGGAAHFAGTVKAVKRAGKSFTEVLLPDFRGSREALAQVAEAGPGIIAHNLETVRRLYSRVRPGACYARSLRVLREAKALGFLTKSGVMLGLGETDEEVRVALADLREAGCDMVTLGQYRQPGPAQPPPARFVLEEGFAALWETAVKLGFRHVLTGSYVRSSYRAGEIRELPEATQGG
jgi:lipoic acid synthetase